MEKYLESLAKFKSIGFSLKERLLLKKIGLYIEGKITITNLIANLSEKNIEFIVLVLNKIAIDGEKSLRYYIELPKNINFDSNYDYAIWAGNTTRFGLFHNELMFRGPRVNDKKVDSRDFLEVSGDINFPNGLLISRNDWLRLLSKCPDLDTYMYSSFKKCRESYSEFSSNIKGYLKNNINLLEKVSNDELNNVEYKVNKNYFNVYKVMDGKTGSFKDVVLNRHI